MNSPSFRGSVARFARKSLSSAMATPFCGQPPLMGDLSQRPPVSEHPCACSPHKPPARAGLARFRGHPIARIERRVYDDLLSRAVNQLLGLRSGSFLRILWSSPRDHNQSPLSLALLAALNALGRIDGVQVQSVIGPCMIVNPKM